MPSQAAPVTSLTEAIRLAIVNGDYAPNQRLIEADMSEAFGASRAAIRSALLELAGEGLVDRLPNKGSRVRAVTVEEAVEIVECRMEVEGLCAAKAAERITDKEIEELRAVRTALVAAVEHGDLVEYSRTHQLMDRRIREISAHHTAVQILERLRAQGVRHQFRLSFQPGRAAVSGPEHVAILDAVIERKPAAAAKATRKHLQGVAKALRAMA